jgi:hypothetical protein
VAFVFPVRRGFRFARTSIDALHRGFVNTGFQDSLSAAFPLVVAGLGAAIVPRIRVARPLCGWLADNRADLHRGTTRAVCTATARPAASTLKYAPGGAGRVFARFSTKVKAGLGG